MAQEIVTLECTEAKALGKPASRYMTTRNKKSPRTPNRLEKKKYNPFLRRRSVLCLAELSTTALLRSGNEAGLLEKSSSRFVTVDALS